MFHGDDERVDVESLRLSTELWEAVADDLLGVTRDRTITGGCCSTSAA